jgi:hypothetical protein
MANTLVSEEDLREMTMEELGKLALESQRVFDERLAGLRGMSAQWSGQQGDDEHEKPRRGRRPKDRSAPSIGNGVADDIELDEQRSQVRQ